MWLPHLAFFFLVEDIIITSIPELLGLSLRAILGYCEAIYFKAKYV
jgi:hypothetical protein